MFRAELKIVVLFSMPIFVKLFNNIIIVGLDQGGGLGLYYTTLVLRGWC